MRLQRPIRARQARSAGPGAAARWLGLIVWMARHHLIHLPAIANHVLQTVPRSSQKKPLDADEDVDDGLRLDKWLLLGVVDVQVVPDGPLGRPR